MTGGTTVVPRWLLIRFDTYDRIAPRLSDLLSQHGALSVTLEDAGDQSLLEPLPGETPLWKATRVVGLFEGTIRPELLLAELDIALAPEPLPPHTLEPLEDQVWERTWMEHFEPMRFGRRVWICPTWREPPDPSGVVLRLDPGLAFGTGSHPTTALCLEWLDAASLARAAVIDYGCGSGVLGIAALKLGARRVWAVDIDPQALTATRANAEANGVVDAMTISHPEALPEVASDLMLANILAGPLVELAPVLAAKVRSGGRLVLSGILRAQAGSVAAAYGDAFEMQAPVFREDWALLAGRRF